MNTTDVVFQFILWNCVEFKFKVIRGFKLLHLNRLCGRMKNLLLAKKMGKTFRGVSGIYKL